MRPFAHVSLAGAVSALHGYSQKRCTVETVVTRGIQRLHGESSLEIVYPCGSMIRKNTQSHWAPKSTNRTYTGLFGALGYGP